MLRTKTIEDQLRKGRLKAKTLDNMFRRRIEEGANCAPFVSQAILKTVKELYPLDHEDSRQQLDVGQIKLLVVAAEEPPGKPLEQCQKVPVVLTFDAGQDDLEVRACRGVVGLRRTKLLRMCCQAREQGGLLSYEDLAYRLASTRNPNTKPGRSAGGACCLRRVTPEDINNVVKSSRARKRKKKDFFLCALKLFGLSRRSG